MTAVHVFTSTAIVDMIIALSTEIVNREYTGRQLSLTPPFKAVVWAVKQSGL